MHNNQFLSIEVKICDLLLVKRCKYQLTEEKFERKKTSSTVSAHQCVLKPYMLVFYYRMNIYREFFLWR